jgi:fluoride ion exporter CrcB/FEX
LKIQEQHQELALNSTDMADAKGQQNSNGISAVSTQIYTISYLILFSMLGTTARLALQALTFFPGAPIIFSELWANFGGTLIMGFLMEDRMLFKEEWGTPVYHNELQKAKKLLAEDDDSVDLSAAKKAHAAVKKTIPLYIGLATGFCGSFTSFSSFIRDAFLALSNDLPTPLNHPVDFASDGTGLTSTSTNVSRNVGFSFLALLAVIIITLSLCVRALYLGFRLAQVFEPYIPSLPFVLTRRVLDRVAMFMAWGIWFSVTILSIFPPNRNWRGIALFALVFAPIGCLGRFYASMWLNSRVATFPLGTFFVNILGTAILGMAFNFQHSAVSSNSSCQVLQGLMDGFCGSLTTISTWVVELTTLKTGDAYRYGFLSIVVAFGLLIAIMGTFRWTVGFSDLKCVH